MGDREDEIKGKGREEIRGKIIKILKENGVGEVIAVKFNENKLIGENFSSETEYVTVILKKEGKQDFREEVSLFIKKVTDNQVQRKMLEETKFFEKEVAFFMEYLPLAMEIARKVGKEKLFNIYPRCYHADKTLLVFDNLVHKGFSLLPKEDLQNFEETTFSLKTIGRHHALAHVTISLHDGGKNGFFNKFPSFKFDSYWEPSMRNMIEPCLESGLDGIILILEKLSANGSQEAIDKFQELKGNAYDKLLEGLTYSSDDFLVLNHGDYWNNNMLFLQDNLGHVNGHVPVDFQQVKWNSPAIDLAYYLYSSVKPEVRQAKLPTLLQIYWESFTKALSELGYPPGETHSFFILLKNFQKKFEFGFWFGALIMNPLSYEIFKEIDISSFADLSEYGINHRKYTAKWIANHPDKVKQLGYHYIHLLKEYQDIKSGLIFNLIN